MYIIRRPVLYFVTLFLFVMLAGGCGSAQPTSQPTIRPTVQPTTRPTRHIRITARLTSTPAPMFTVTWTPSRTDRPSATPTPSATIDLTREAFYASQVPTIQAERTSSQRTQEARVTLNAAFPEACGYEYPSVSPDGNWLADDCGEFHVVSRDGQKKIVITHEELAPPDSNVAYVIPYYWTKDSQYLYFTTRFCCADNEGSAEGPLYRLDVQSSARVKIIDGGFNLYSFSSTGRRLLHIPNNQAGAGRPVRFHLIDLKSGEEQWLFLQNFELAYVNRWSADGTRFIITAKIGNIFEENRQYALFLVSLNDQSFTQLIPLSDHDVRAINWSSDDVLTIEDCFYDGQFETCKTFPYDLKPLISPKP